MKNVISQRITYNNIIINNSDKHIPIEVAFEACDILNTSCCNSDVHTAHISNSWSGFTKFNTTTCVISRVCW